MANNGKLTDGEARILSGAGAITPPNLEPRSRSEGDLNRNAYRASKWDRLSARAVVNDDGTPIAATTEDLLRLLLELTERQNELLAREPEVVAPEPGLLSIDEAMAKGMGRSMTIGSLTTPVGAGTVTLLAQPMFAIGVPAGYIIRPIYVHIQTSGILIVADNDEVDILIGADTKGYWQGSGTFTNEVASNLRTDLGPGSSCRTASVFTADLTTVNSQNVAAAPVMETEISHEFQVAEVAGVAANVIWRRATMHYEPRHAPYIVGPATVLGYWGGTTIVTAFAQIQWVEGRIAEMLRAV